MIMLIGIVAGDIWNLLDRRAKLRISEIVAELSHPKDIILMGLGWLAREGHIVLEGEEDPAVSLRKQ